MQFVTGNNVFTRRGKKTVWLEQGVYPVVRLFDANRVIVDCSTLTTPKRQLTILDLSQGTILNDSKKKTATAKNTP